MASIVSLLSVLCFAALLLTVLGLIWPRFVVRWEQPEGQTRKKVLSTYGLAALLSFIFLFALSPAPRKDIVADTTKQTTSTHLTNNNGTITDNKPSRDDNSTGLTVLDSDFLQEGRAGYITGTVQNNTNRAYRYVEVNINVYDESGAQIASPMANTQNLQAGGTWKFKAPIIPHPTGRFSFEVIKVTGRH